MAVAGAKPQSFGKLPVVKVQGVAMQPLLFPCLAFCVWACDPSAPPAAAPRAPTAKAPAPQPAVLPVALDLFVLEWRLVEGAADLSGELAWLQRARQPLTHFSLTHGLEAFLADQVGDEAAREAALGRLRPARAVAARHFFVDRPRAAVEALLAAHVAEYCPSVGNNLPPHLQLPDAPCPSGEDRPSDYAAFEQWAGASHSEGRVQQWATTPDRLTREDFVSQLGVARGESVADVGAGEGFFLDAFAQAVGPEGRVTAVEVDASLVEHLRWYAGALGHANVSAQLAPLERPALARGAHDVVFVCEVLKAVVSNRTAATPAGRAAALTWLEDAAQGLKPDGRLVVVDHAFGDAPDGPSFSLLETLFAEVGLVHRVDLEGYGKLNKVLVFTRDKPWTLPKENAPTGH